MSGKGWNYNKIPVKSGWEWIKENYFLQFGKCEFYQVLFISLMRTYQCQFILTKCSL